MKTKQWFWSFLALVLVFVASSTNATAQTYYNQGDANTAASQAYDELAEAEATHSGAEAARSSYSASHTYLGLLMMSSPGTEVLTGPEVAALNNLLTQAVAKSDSSTLYLEAGDFAKNAADEYMLLGHQHYAMSEWDPAVVYYNWAKSDYTLAAPCYEASDADADAAKALIEQAIDIFDPYI